MRTEPLFIRSGLKISTFKYMITEHITNYNYRIAKNIQRNRVKAAENQ